MKKFKQISLVCVFIFFLSHITMGAWAAERTVKKRQDGQAAGTQVKPGKKPGSIKIKPSKSLSVMPDLMISVKIIGKIESGRRIPNCMVTVKNNGGYVANGSGRSKQNGYRIALCLSKDNIIQLPPISEGGDYNDFAVDSFFDISIDPNDDRILPDGLIKITPDLKPGESKIYNLYNKLLIPKNLPDGIYYLGGVVDYGKQVVEANENNNSCAVPLRVRAVLEK